MILNSVRQLPAITDTSIDELIQGFVPTRRFAHVSFDTYVPDPAYPSQAQAQQRMRAFAADVSAPPRGLFRRRRRPRAIYLDGGYGVGKTHLLAATYHALAGRRVYLSFAELAYTISRMGLGRTLAAFGDMRLLCIDEFELDDVAQTRMASMFLRGMLSGQTNVVTTSNTLPSDLGRGRFAADAFQREIGELAASFEVVTIDGHDYRRRLWSDLGTSETINEAAVEDRFTADESKRKVLLSWTQLAKQLEDVHPVHYAQIAARIDALYVTGLACINDLAVALRLVHFVDKLYGQEVRLTLSTTDDLPLGEIFGPGYRHGGYEKKYRRCLSRLHELVAETNACSRQRSGASSLRANAT